MRLAHLGDNGTLTDEVMEAMGPVDLLVARAAGSFDDIEPVVQGLGVRVLVPNHYRVPSISELPEAVSTVDEWLGDRPAERLEKTRQVYTRGDLPERTRIDVFTPSSAVRRWPESMHRAWKEIGAASELNLDTPEALALYRRAVELAPDVMRFRWLLGRSLEAAGHRDEAVAALEEGLARVPLDDWTDELRARALLGKLYAESGHWERAAAQYRWVVSQRQTYAANERANAQKFLDAHRR